MWARHQHGKSLKFHWVEPVRLAPHYYRAPCGECWSVSLVVASTSIHVPANACKTCVKWVERNAKQ